MFRQVCIHNCRKVHLPTAVSLDTQHHACSPKRISLQTFLYSATDTPAPNSYTDTQNIPAEALQVAKPEIHTEEEVKWEGMERTKARRLKGFGFKVTNA